MLVVAPVSAWLIRDVVRAALMSGRGSWLVAAATVAGAGAIALGTG